ncbi:MAG: polysaccharide biosynthesis tyrosine autokinase [Rhodobacteraceae bacterium]|nr:polysaccharide biosynthesis tyrosine autokinase [Paracoccaceae bacterium]
MLQRSGNLKGPISVRVPAPGEGGHSDPQASDPDFTRLANALWRGKWLIAAVALLAFVASGLYAYRFATPVYSATAQIVLDGRQQTVTGLDSVVSALSTDQITINTELEVIRSRRLIGLLVDRLGLTEVPEYNPWLAPDPPALGWQSIKDGVKSWVFASQPRATSPPEPDQLHDIVVNAVRARIATGNLNRTSVFTITASSTDRNRAAVLANTLAEIYILDQLETKFQGTQKATEWLSRRVADLRVELEADEAAVKALTAASDLVSARDFEMRNLQIKDLRDRADALQQALATSTGRLALLEAAIGDPVAMQRAADDPALTKLGADGHTETTAQFSARYDAILAQVDAILSTLEGVEISVAEQSLDLVELQQLQREADASRAIYESFLARLKETSVQQGIQSADSRILSQATRPNYAATPRKRQMVLNASALAALLAGALVILWELAQKGFRSPEALEATTGYPVVGQVPLVPGASPAQKLRYLIEKPNSAAAEAVRNLRTSVLTQTDAAQVIMVTSSVPAEGKTTQAIALAQNIAAMGRKVMLIECDVRRPSFRDYFGPGTGTCLSDILSGSTLPEAAVFHEVVPGMAVIAGAAGQGNAADLFTSEAFDRLIAWARGAFDVVIIDTPPVLVVPDARVIAARCDTLLYVVRWDRTSPAQVLDGLRQLETPDRRCDGLILARVDPKRMRALGLAHRNGTYAAYGRAYYES